MRQQLDGYLGKVTMYRLVLLALVGLYLVSLILSMTGILPYTPKAMVVSLVTLLSVSYISNRIFGWLYGIRPHGESALITGFILFFLFIPTDKVVPLASLVLVALIASASKYVLVVRGRHIFNPVAIAAVIISWMGFAVAVWWIATPALLLVTLLFAILVLYKTRRLGMGAVFVGVSASLIVLHAVLGGQSLAAGITSLASWPILFFVGFMASEPLTLPPRAWQRYTEMVLVGVLFAWPISLAGITITTPLALVIGNIFAFLWGQRRAVILKFISKHRLTPTSYELVFKSQSPLRFAAGQYVELTLPHAHADSRGLRRVFSIASPPRDDTVRLGIKLPETPSSFKKQLLALQSGEQLQATGIGGDFVLPLNNRQSVLLVAGGIGITPFISQLLSVSSEQLRHITLVYALSSREELAYRAELVKVGARVIIVTPDYMPDLPAGWKQIEARQLTVEHIAQIVTSYRPAVAYISGPPAMVTATKTHLLDANVKRIKTDYFTGY